MNNKNKLFNNVHKNIVISPEIAQKLKMAFNDAIEDNMATVFNSKTRKAILNCAKENGIDTSQLTAVDILNLIN